MAVVSLPDAIPIRTFPAGATLWRAHGPKGVLFFGPPSAIPVNRFDAPDGSFKVCYLGVDEGAAFVEGVLHQPVPSGFVTRATLATRSIAEVRVLAPIRALQLHGPHLLRLGWDASVIHGPSQDYIASQEWSRVVHSDARDLDAIVYSSRHDEGTLSLALYDRASARIKAGESSLLGPDDARTLRLLKRYGLGLAP